MGADPWNVLSQAAVFSTPTKLTMKLLSTWAVACLAAQAAGAALSHKLDGLTIREHPDAAKRAQLQKYVRGMRISLFRLELTRVDPGDLG